MTYNPAIPQPNDLLSDSQGDILQNFGAANTSFGINHYAFDDATVKNGKHKFVSLPVQIAAPATTAGEGALYFKTSGSGSALFMVRDNNVGTEVQLTSASVGNVFAATDGYCWLPGGLFMQWGFAAVTIGVHTVTFPVAFAAAAYNVQITPVLNSSVGGQNVYMGSTTATDFTYSSTSSNILRIYWVAIGTKP